MTNRLERLFNFIVVFGLYQSDIVNLLFDSRMAAYFDKLKKDFAGTTFGVFYLRNKVEIDSLVSGVEDSMTTAAEDRLYSTKMAVAIGRL